MSMFMIMMTLGRRPGPIRGCRTNFVELMMVMMTMTFGVRARPVWFDDYDDGDCW